MVVDVERFGDRRRTNPRQVIVRDALYEVVQRALAEAGIPWAACRHEDRGDGVLVLAPAQIPKTPFVEIVPGVLAVGLREHNGCHPVEEQVRLRMALHAGEVQFDRHGVTSAAVNHAFRLLDARPLKTALADSPGELALITSGWFFEDVVRHSRSVDAMTFRPVWVSEKEPRPSRGSRCPTIRTRRTRPRSPLHQRNLPRDRCRRRCSACAVTSSTLSAATTKLRTLLDTAAGDGPMRGIAVHAVAGMPGVGKTAFSVHAAHHLSDRFPDGQIFLELYGHAHNQAPREPADALASLLIATGMDRSALPTEVDDRARLWRDRIAGKKVLLVLDDAASHDQLRPLLPGTPECSC
jgi:hypothetical protein